MVETILSLINENPINAAKTHDLLAKMNAADIAEILDEVNKEKAIQIFRLLPKSIASDVFAYVSSDSQQYIIEALTDSEVGRIMNELFVDDAVDFIDEMPANIVKRVLQNTRDEKRQLINQILQYPDDSAGSIMTTEYVDLREDLSVKEAFDHIRKTGVDKETIYTCYVIKRNRLLVGAVSLKTLMFADPNSKIDDIMDTNLLFAYTTDDQEVVADMFRKYDLLSMPVVDKEQQLVGIITVDDVVQIIEDENTEDFQIMAAIKPSDEPYLKTGVLKHASNRIPWLLFLMLSATITGGIIASFEASLAILPTLVAFIPMIMGTGGNASVQSSTVIIRSIALGEIRSRDILNVLWREIRIGALCGLVLSVVNFIRIYLVNGKDAMLSFTITISLLGTLIMAKSVGCVLPIVAKKLKLDPAIMAAPLITTIVDGLSLLIYFSIAKIVILR